MEQVYIRVDFFFFLGLFPSFKKNVTNFKQWLELSKNLEDTRNLLKRAYLPLQERGPPGPRILCPNVDQAKM